MARAFMLLYFLAASLEVVHGLGTEFHCVHFGGGRENINWASGNSGKNSRRFMQTIGTSEMDAMWLTSLGASYNAWWDYRTTPLRSFVDVLMKSPLNSKCPWEWGYVCPPGWRLNVFGQTLPGGRDHCLSGIRIEPCVDNSLVRMNIYLVKQGGRILQGWLHIEIELLDQTQEEIELVYIEMQDEQHQAIGEFVNADVVPGAACKLPGTSLSTPARAQFYPCGSITPREAKASQGLMMAKKEFYYDLNDLKRKKYLHEQPIKNGVHFLWRINEYWCNRHQRIRPFAMILTAKNRKSFKAANANAVSVPERMWRKVPKHWIHLKWIGAADTIFKRGEDGQLDCSLLAINDNTGELTSEASNSWIQTSSASVLKDDQWNPRFVFAGDLSADQTSEICQLNPYSLDSSGESTVHFGGRCSVPNKKQSSRDHFQDCNTDPNTPPFEGLNTTRFKVYDEYIKEKQKGRLKSCDAKCIKPETQEDYDAILSFPSLNDTEEDVKPTIIVGKNDPRTRSKYFKLRAARKYHGICFSFLAFFITPLSVFVARYYKETFMRRRCYGMHVWYWNHIGGIVASLCVGMSGHSALSQFYRVWGRSADGPAKLHRGFGYASIGCFFFLLVFGGFRIRAMGIGRKITITLHAVVGFAHHWFNLISVMHTAGIPMSPTLKDCDGKGMPQGLSAVFWLAVGWLMIDFIFHVILTVLHVVRDRMIGTWRPWYFPIVPLVENEQMADMPGEKLRTILLWIYTFIALAFATASSLLILYHISPATWTLSVWECNMPELDRVYPDRAQVWRVVQAPGRDLVESWSWLSDAVEAI